MSFGESREGFPLRCGACIGNTFAVDRCVSLFHYSSPINKLVSQFKYSAKLDIGSCFGQLLGAALKKDPFFNSDTVLIPVPMHPLRFLQRGFNQAWELTHAASRISGLRAENRLARKSRHTPPQSSLSSCSKRRENLRNSYILTKKPGLSGVSRVTIIDDVVTTMSTVSALAKCLKNEGIQWVEVWCVARAGDQK